MRSRALTPACDFAVEFLKWPSYVHSIAPDNVAAGAGQGAGRR